MKKKFHNYLIINLSHSSVVAKKLVVCKKPKNDGKEGHESMESQEGLSISAIINECTAAEKE